MSWEYLVRKGETEQSISILWIKQLSNTELPQPLTANVCNPNKAVAQRCLDIYKDAFIGVVPRDDSTPGDKIIVLVPVLSRHGRFFGRRAKRKLELMVHELPTLKSFLGNCIRTMPLWGLND